MRSYDHWRQIRNFRNEVATLFVEVGDNDEQSLWKIFSETYTVWKR